MTKTPFDITILTGPTASGKTARAIDIANERNGIILNADAMQMYDSLPILTAQPSAEEQAAAPHRLYGIRAAHEDINAASWSDIALQEIQQCEESGTHPIFVGGTGFYIRSLINGLSPIPNFDPSIRTRLNEKDRKNGTESLYKMLEASDPEMASRLRPSDTQRIIRALEVLEGTGRSLSYWQDLPLVTPPEHYRFRIIVLWPDKDRLNQKIERRISQMLDMGALQEIKELSCKIENGEALESAFIVKAHGFRPFRNYINGLWTLEQASEHTAIETRQYAKRQRTWARSQFAADKLPARASIEFIDV